MREWTSRVLASLMLVSGSVFAQAAEEVSPAVDTATPARPFQIEGFMFLTGRLATDGEGRVYWHEVDDALKVPEQVIAFVARQAAGWVVESVQGGHRAASLQMTFSMSVRASPAGDGLFQLWPDGVSVDVPLQPEARIRIRSRSPIQYSRSLARIGAGGIVYLLLKIDEDGRVQDLFARQIDLTALPTDLEQAMWIQAELSASAATAVRRWRFQMPTEGAAAGRPAIVGISVDFFMEEQPPGYGEWRYLVRGRRNMPPWASESEAQMEEPLVPDHALRPIGLSYRVRSTLADAEAD